MWVPIYFFFCLSTNFLIGHQPARRLGCCFLRDFHCWSLEIKLHSVGWSVFYMWGERGVCKHHWSLLKPLEKWRHQPFYYSSWDRPSACDVISEAADEAAVGEALRVPIYKELAAVLVCFSGGGEEAEGAKPWSGQKWYQSIAVFMVHIFLTVLWIVTLSHPWKHT